MSTECTLNIRLNYDGQWAIGLIKGFMAESKYKLVIYFEALKDGSENKIVTFDVTYLDPISETRKPVIERAIKLELEGIICHEILTNRPLRLLKEDKLEV